MLGPATRQCREIARRQSWFLHSAAPQVVPVVVVRTKRSRLRTRRFAQTAALPSVRTLHAPRAATSVQACRSRRASRPPDSRPRSVMTDRDDDLRRRFATTDCIATLWFFRACDDFCRPVVAAKPRRGEPQTSASRARRDSRKKTFFVTRRLAARVRFDPVKYASLLRPAASR